MGLLARNISFSYQRSENILHSLSFGIECAERVGLSAPSGVGKTTLCRLLAGIESPQSGEVLLDGKDIRSYRGFCPVQLLRQHPETALDPRLTLGQSLREVGALDEDLLRRLRIRREWLTRYPSELSGGELQRFCIARVLRHELRYLLCDETTAMLDGITQAQIWQVLLEEARARSLGLLIVSHDSALLARLCTRIETWSEEYEKTT